MPIKQFDDNDDPIILKSEGNLIEKINLLRNLYDKSYDKINHFDKLRQQLINFAIVVFSALIAFIIKTEDNLMKVLGCLGITVLMAIFRSIDRQHHKGIHGYFSNMFIFTKVTAYLLNNPKDDVSFTQYYEEGEKNAKQWNFQTRIYFILGFSSFVFGIIIVVREIIVH
jgi:hypothetical protein